MVLNGPFVWASSRRVDGLIGWANSFGREPSLIQLLMPIFAAPHAT